MPPVTLRVMASDANGRRMERTYNSAAIANVLAPCDHSHLIITVEAHNVATLSDVLKAQSIRKSSSAFPDFNCAVNQRGCFPRPAQVSDGRAGFWYLGNTRWYRCL